MNRFEMKLLKNYHYLYLKRDVSLLPHVFEKFRNKSLKNYGLFPSYYLDAQGFIWYSMLKLTKLKLELFSEHVYKGTRGELSHFSSRCSKVNNQYLKS